MTYFIFAGDMLVMAFMIGLVVWVSLSSSAQALDEAARIPLEDEDAHGNQQAHRYQGPGVGRAERGPFPLAIDESHPDKGQQQQR